MWWDVIKLNSQQSQQKSSKFHLKLIPHFMKSSINTCGSYNWLSTKHPVSFFLLPGFCSAFPPSISHAEREASPRGKCHMVQASCCSCLSDQLGLGNVLQFWAITYKGGLLRGFKETNFYSYKRDISEVAFRDYHICMWYLALLQPSWEPEGS